MGKKPPVVYVWPDMPSKRTALSKIAKELGWELTNRPRRNPLFGIRFEDLTHKTPVKLPNEMQSDVQWWNADCSDISKKAVEQHHVAAFGYGMAVDPLSHIGNMVCKSDVNAMHDGRVMEGPILPEAQLPSVVYQREINNTDENGRYFDYRVVYVQGAIALVYRKFKNAERRFTNETEHVELLDGNPFSPEESDSMRAMAASMGIHYAEFDALRDRGTGQLFVVDVNPTPWGPPAQLDSRLQIQAVKRMSEVFQACTQ